MDTISTSCQHCIESKEMVDNVESARHRVKIVIHKLYQEYHLIKEALLKRHIMILLKNRRSYLFIYLLIYLFIYLSIYLFIYFYLSIDLFHSLFQVNNILLAA